MILPADAACLPDVKVWIAALSDRNEHRVTAGPWFDAASASICFCRVIQMAFLRLLTNPKVMGEDTASQAEVITVYRQLFTEERVRFEPEPPTIESAWISLMSLRVTSGSSTWTDAYLAALAVETNSRMISFDQGLDRWPGLALELLMPA